ncbi:MAG: hypothetical protein P4L83_13225 [Nevskia sp.]|nr:hypothetical protein [Nevskia sp.]
MSLTPLDSFKKNVYSQNGEDGLVEEILNRIRSAVTVDRWCVEFGAMDGVYLSNACNLIRNHGYRAVMIEADKSSYKKLCRNLSSQEVIKIRRLVSFEGPSSLENILQTTPIPIDFDFLSIDIDGCDYYILKSLQAYRPKLICIEYNHSIPNEVEFIQPEVPPVFRLPTGRSHAARFCG